LDKVDKIIEEALNQRHATLETLLLAFMSEVGCKPSEAVLNEQYKNGKFYWWFSKRELNEQELANPSVCNKDR